MTGRIICQDETRQILQNEYYMKRFVNILNSNDKERNVVMFFIFCLNGGIMKDSLEKGKEI